MDFTRLRSVYCIGIKGSGVAGLAQILKARGVRVTGSDTKERYFTERGLRRWRIPYREGFDAENIRGALPLDAVVSSAAYLKRQNGKIVSTNPEVREALALKIPVVTYPEMVAELFNRSFGIAVCGSHGKSSTTAFLGTLLEKAGLDPTVLVGSEVTAWHSNMRAGKLRQRACFVLEADEYREAFLNYEPKIVLLTNIDWDHPDYFPNARAYRHAYERFAKNIAKPGALITYERLRVPRSVAYRRIAYDPATRFPFYIPGEHFQRNLQLCYELAKRLRITKHFVPAVRAYTGIKRRFEIVGNVRGITLVDDYGHHPSEVRAFWNSVQLKFPERRVWFVFQPHTYSRTAALFRGFVSILRGIPNLLLLKTFSSAREANSKRNARVDAQLTRALPRSRYFATPDAVTRFLAAHARKTDVIVTCGAGDGYKILQELKHTKRKSAHP